MTYKTQKMPVSLFAANRLCQVALLENVTTLGPHNSESTFTLDLQIAPNNAECTTF